MSMLARLGLGTKLAAASVLLLVLAGFVAERLSAYELEEAMIGRIVAELSTKLNVLEDEALAFGDPIAGTGRSWEAFANRFGQRAGVRVTLIAPDGTVVGDSEVSEGDLGHLENHAMREEVARAREHGEGTSIRLSPTLGVRMIYFARPFPAPGRDLGVLRLAVPLTSVDAALSRYRRLILVGTAIAIAAAVAISIAGTYFMTRPVRDLTKVALAMSQGNLDARTRLAGEDEPAKLGRALNRLADELSHTIVELRGERDLLAGILDGMGEGVLVVDGADRILLANQALRRMALLGDDAIGRSVLEALRNADLHEAIEGAREGDDSVVREIELAGLLPRKVLVRVSRLVGGDREAIAVFHDVTDLRRLETVRTDFVANVSHELRTPVTAISTAAETLAQGALHSPTEAAEFVDVIERQAKRLRQLVDDLLDLAKIEAKTFRLTIADADVRPVIVHAVSLIQEAARRRRVTVAIDQPDGALRARFDRRALEQALSNLLDNAIKYAGERATVRIASSCRDGRVEIAVSDNGPGIPAAHLGRIFERFYRVDPGRSRDVGGTGLGLSIVKHLVEQMEGTVDVESALGRGTTFTVRLPPSA